MDLFRYIQGMADYIFGVLSVTVNWLLSGYFTRVGYELEQQNMVMFTTYSELLL